MPSAGGFPHARAPSTPPAPASTRGARLLAVALAAAHVLGGCATSRTPTTPALALRALIDAGDLAGAEALIAASGSTLDARRALDVSIRAGDAGAVRDFLERAAIDAELDSDGTTALIRAVLDAPPASRAARGSRSSPRPAHARTCATTTAATR